MNVIGNFFGSDGYSIHTRNLIRALGKVTDVRLTTGQVPNWERMVDDKELELIKKQPVDDEINLIITSPLHWKMNATSKRNWVFLIWEGDRIPKCFIEECLNPDIEYIFVPSLHTMDALFNTEFSKDILAGDLVMLKNKVKLIPHGVDLRLFYPKDKSDKCVFIANKGFRNLEDRGGIQYLIRAYFEEFNDKDDVELLLKINPAYGIPDLNRLIGEISPRTNGLPRLNININNIEYSKMVDLYNTGTVFVSPTRAEAYNLPCIEAMACGLPVITTNFGGQMDYVNNDNGWIIGGELEEVKHEVMYEGIKWLTPNILELRKAMRKAYSNNELVKQKSMEATKTANDNTWEKTADKIKELI